MRFLYSTSFIYTCFIYAKGNPTRGTFERAIAAAEKAKYCVAFSSGMSAISAIVHLLSPHDKILCIDDVYGGTQRYFRKIVYPTMGIEVEFDDFSLDSLERKMRYFGGNNEKKFKLLWLETPTNPLLKVGNIVLDMTQHFIAIRKFSILYFSSSSHIQGF